MSPWTASTVAILLIAGCGPSLPDREGERAASDGECPPGETCSDHVPGSTFEAAEAIAVGARHEVTVMGGVEELGAASSDPSILAVDGVAPPHVQLRGVAPGRAHLRVTVPDSGELLDRLNMRVEEVAVVTVVPDAFWFEPDRWVMYNRAEPSFFPIVPALLAEDGTRLAADDARITARTGDADTSDSLSFEIDALGRSWTVAIPFRDRFDDIVLIDDSIILANHQLACFTTVADGTAVYGVPLAFDWTARLYGSEAMEDGPWGCVHLASRRGQLTVTAGSVRRTFQVSVDGDGFRVAETTRP